MNEFKKKRDGKVQVAGNKNPTDTGTDRCRNRPYIYKEVSACPTTIYLESLEPF